MWLTAQPGFKGLEDGIDRGLLPARRSSAEDLPRSQESAVIDFGGGTQIALELAGGRLIASG